MKKKILSITAVLAVAVAAAWNVQFSSQTNGMSDVMLANVEALAQESGEPNICEISYTEWTCNWYNKDGYCPCGSV